MRLASVGGRLLACACILVGAAVAGAGPPAWGSSYTVPQLFEVTTSVTLGDEIHTRCLVRADVDGMGVSTRGVCYSSYKPDPIPESPLEQYYDPVSHRVGSGVFNPPVLALIAQPCTDAGRLGSLSVQVVVQLDKAGGNATGQAVVTLDTEEPLDCYDGAEITGPATLEPLALDNDEDGDGCTDYFELGEHGLFDPFNPGDCGDVMDESGIYYVLEEWVASGEDPGAYRHCLADVVRDGNDLTARTYCYVDTPDILVNPELDVNGDTVADDCATVPEACGDGFPGEPPPEPLGDVDDVHAELTGAVDGGQNKVLLSGCFEDRDDQAPLGDVYVEWLQDTESGAGTADVWVSQPGGCAGSPVGAPAYDGAQLYATKVGEEKEPGQEVWHDSDGDNCPDEKELDDDEMAGGLRDPFNHWDYFNPTHDGLNRVDDILAVVNQYFIDKGGPGYTKETDRTSLVGGNLWNLGPPNGQQRSDDYLAAVHSYFHDCSGGTWVDDDTYPKPE